MTSEDENVVTSHIVTTLHVAGNWIINLVFNLWGNIFESVAERHMNTQQPTELHLELNVLR